MTNSDYDIFFEDVQDNSGGRYYSGTLNKPFRRPAQPSAGIPEGKVPEIARAISGTAARQSFRMPLRTDVDMDRARETAARAAAVVRPKALPKAGPSLPAAQAPFQPGQNHLTLPTAAKPLVSPSGMVGNTGIRLPSASPPKQAPAIGNTGVRLPVMEGRPEYKGALAVPSRPDNAPIATAGKWLAGNTMAGIGTFNSGLAKTADMILPDVITPGPVQNVIDRYKGEVDRYQPTAQEINRQTGTELAGSLFQSTVTALPNAAMAILSQGQSVAAQMGPQASGLMAAISASIKQLARNPMFWTSFAQTTGTTYEDAKDQGANELEAQATALISGVLNAAVEVGGGIETFGQNGTGVAAWVRTMLDEGKEEVIQGAIEQLTKKAIYAPELPYYSAENPEAVVNPSRAVREFGGGAAVGGILGGGQIAAGAALGALRGAGIETDVQIARSDPNPEMRGIMAEEFGRGNAIRETYEPQTPLLPAGARMENGRVVLPTAEADANLPSNNLQVTAPVIRPTAEQAAQGYDTIRFVRNEAGELPYAGRFDFNVDKYLDMLQNIETPQDYKVFRDGIKRQMDDLDAIRGRAVDAYADYIYGYRGQGVSLQPTFGETGETVNRIRVSNNEPWYSKYAGRRLSKADARALAERVVDTPRMQADFPEIVPRQTMADIQTLSDMRDELHHFYSYVLSRENFLGAKQLGNQYSVYYGDPSVAYATPEGYNKIKGKSLKELDITSAPWEEINLSPEIQRARARAKFDEPTVSVSTPERAELRLEIADKLYALGSFAGKDPNGNEVFSGPVARGRHADIVIGPPAAGKSSVFANALSRDHQARIIDSDMAKAMLPEFDGGYGAGRVHKESDAIARDLLIPASTKNGENIVLPLVGKNTGKIRDIARELKAQGYTVNLYLNDLPVDKAARRAVTRFMETGRFVDPDYVLSIGATPNETYDILRREGLFDEYVKKSNDVARGEPPVLLDQFTNTRDVHTGGLYGLGQGQRQIQAGRVGRNGGGSHVGSPPEAPGTAGTGAPGSITKRISPVSQLSGRYGEERPGRTDSGALGGLQKIQRRVYEFPGDGGGNARIGFEEIEPAFLNDQQRSLWNSAREKGFTAHFVPSESVIEVEGQRITIPKGAAFSYPEKGLIFADAHAPERVFRHEIFHTQAYAHAPAAQRTMRRIAALVDQGNPAFKRYETLVRKDYAARGLEATFNDVLEEFSAELYGAIPGGAQAARWLGGFFQNDGFARAVQIMQDFERGAADQTANRGGEGPIPSPKIKRYTDTSTMPPDDGRAASLGGVAPPLTRAQLDEIARTGSLSDADAPAESRGKRIDRILNDPETIPSVEQVESDPDMPVSYEGVLSKETAEKLTNSGISYSKDLSRNLDATAGKDAAVRAELRQKIERPAWETQKAYGEAVVRKLNEVLQIIRKTNIKPGSKESAAAQWYGEGFLMDKYGDMHEYTLEMLKQEFPDKWKEIVEVSKFCRGDYDDYFGRINETMRKVFPDAEVRGEKKLLDLEARINYIEQVKIPETIQDLELASDPMEKARLKDELANLQNYARLMNGEWAKLRAQIDDGTYLIGKRLQYRENYFPHYREKDMGITGLKNILSTPADIDPDLVGVSDFTEPNSKWTGFMQQRQGGRYQADALGGLIRYIVEAERKIHYDPLIAWNRGIIRQLRQDTAKLRNANKFIEWMNDHTNDLAGKTNPIDRPVQKLTNRQVMAAVDWLNRRVRTNAVLGNINSAVAQVFNIPNAVGYIKNPAYLTKGAVDWGRYVMGDAELSSAIDQSGFIKERYLQKSISRFDEGIAKAPRKFAEWMLNVGDEQSTVYIWFSAYEQAKARNMENPVEYADDITRRSVAGRGIGEIPLLQKAKITTLFAPFQIEVNNAYQVLKEKFREKDLAAIFGIFLSSWLLNNLSEKLTGRRVAFDPINATIEAVKEANELEDATPGEKTAIVGTRLAGETLSNMPFGSMIAATFVPEEYRSSLFGENDPTRYGTGNMGINAVAEPILQMFTGRNPDWLSAAANVALPWGGKQVERTLKAAQDMKILPRFTDNFDEGAKDLPASYSAGGGFRFPIDTGNPLNVARGLMFGTFSTEEGQQYLAEGRKPLSEDKTALIKEAAAQGISANDFLRVYNDLKKFETIKDEKGKTLKSQTQQQMEYLRDANLPADQKAWFNQNLISHTMVIPEESNVDFTSDETYIITQLPESAQELYSHPEVREAVGGAENFVKIRDIYENIKADTDEYGNSISGTAKTKRIAEIASALDVTEQRAGDIYDELFVRKHSMDELGSAARRAYEMGLATKNMSAKDYLKYTNVMNTTEGGKEEKIEALMENGLDEKHAEYVYAATHSFAYRIDDLSAKEREKYEQQLKPHNMGERQFLELRNGLSQVEGTKGANGRTISGSQKRNRYQYLIQQGMAPKEARYLLSVMYDYKW